MKKLITCLLLILLTACSSVSSEVSAETPMFMTAEVSTILPAGSGGEPTVSTPEPEMVVPAELKYRVLEEFPDFFYCDPDLYPVARADEAKLAAERFPEIQADRDTFLSIVSHVGLNGTTSFSDEQKLLIYREYKKLNAIYFEAAGDEYTFQVQTGSEGQEGTFVTATIDRNGSIDVLQREQSFPSCPICLAAGTLIDTPQGAVLVENLQVGDVVWTANDAGERVAEVILQLGRVRAPASHHVIHVMLDDGREVWASAGHPTADDKRFADLAVGDMMDGSLILMVESVPYSGVFTFDILPSGDTGFYWANGILIGSTLHK